MKVYNGLALRTRRFGQPFGPLPRFAAAEDVDVNVTEKTALKGMMLWVLGGVLTHIAIRWVDSTFYRR